LDWCSFSQARISDRQGTKCIKRSHHLTSL
jgi:hypothetical protein